MLLVALIIIIIGLIVKVGRDNQANFAFCFKKPEVCEQARKAYDKNVREPLFMIPLPDADEALNK